MESRNPIFFYFNNDIDLINFVKEINFITKKRHITQYYSVSSANNISYVSLKLNPNENLDKQHEFISGIYTNHSSHSNSIVMFFSYELYLSIKKQLEFVKTHYINPRFNNFYQQFYSRLKY